MKRYLLLIQALLLVCFVNAQYLYEEATNIEVIKNGKNLAAPFTSGYNTAQFSEIDLNQDGVMDLIVYDRSMGQVRPYINQGIKDSVAYTYDPSYAKQFPQLRSWLLTADYNEDGKMDLFDGESGIRLWKNISNSTDGLQFELIGDLRSLYNPNNTQTIKIASNSTNLPGIYDVDQDGDLDIFTIHSNFGNTIEYHRNLAIENGDPDYLDFERRSQCWGEFYDSSGVFILGDCDRSTPGGEIIIPEDNSQTENQYNPTKHKEKQLKHGISAMITPIDIDGNSSTDLIISDFDTYKTKLLLNEDSVAPFVDSRMYRIIDSFPNYDVPIDVLYPAVFFIDVNNDGKKDMIGISNTVETFVDFNLTLDDIFYYKNISTTDKIKLEFQQRDFLKEETLDFGLSAHPAFFDYNKDGLYDLVVSNDGYVSMEENGNNIIGNIQLFKNIGTTTSPKFELVDSNYLDMRSKKLNYRFIGSTRVEIPTRNIYLTFGDIDDDGDEDLFLGDINDNIYLFEDTSINQSEAKFKFHPTPYSGLNIRNLGGTNSPRLYDINNDEVLDLIVSDQSSIVYYFLNFGTKSNPIFNIRLDSIIFLTDRIFRYYFEDTPNFELFKVGDSVAVNNGTNPSNNAFIKLFITSINEQDNYIECRNSINSPPSVDSRYNETNTDAYLTFYDRSWGNLRESLRFLANPIVFPYRENGETQLLVGSVTGDVHYFNRISDTINPRDTFQLFDEKYVPNYGILAAVDGKDINNDGMMDLVVGNFSGGIQILLATQKNEPLFSFEPSSILLGPDSLEETSFNINTNYSHWEVIEKVNWLKVTPEEGSYSTEITIQATDSNDTGNIRTDSILIVSPPHVLNKIFVSQDTARSVGLEEPVRDIEISIFPNPSKGIVNIEASTNGPIPDVEIFSSIGKLITVPITQLSDKSLQLNFNDFPNGIYYVSLKLNGKNTITRKISVLK